MKRGRRRKPQTVLDQLELDGVIDSTLAGSVRRFAKRQPAPLTLTETADLLSFAHALVQPARASTRRANQRAFAMAYERLYLKSLGNRDATTKTAKRWSVSTRTVSAAVKRHSGMSMEPDSKRNVEWQRAFAMTRKRLSSKSRKR